MSAENWTPGPWVAEPNTAFWEVRPSTPLEHGMPARIGDVCASSPSNRDGGLQEANARLIAAAPELYEALKAAMDYIDTSPCNPDIYPEQHQAWKRLWETRPRETLAKARGEQEGT